MQPAADSGQRAAGSGSRCPAVLDSLTARLTARCVLRAACYFIIRVIVPSTILPIGAGGRTRMNTWKDVG